MNKQNFVIAAGLALFTFATCSEASLISNHTASSQIELTTQVGVGRALAPNQIEAELGPAALTAEGRPSLETPFLIASIDDNSVQNCEMLFDAEGEPSHGLQRVRRPSDEGCESSDPNLFAPKEPAKTPATESAKDTQAVETPAKSEGSGLEPAADASGVAAESDTDSQEATEEEEAEDADSTGDDTDTDTDTEGAADEETAEGTDDEDG